MYVHMTKIHPARLVLLLSLFSDGALPYLNDGLSLQFPAFELRQTTRVRAHSQGYKTSW